jgi:hypothetical protein
MSEAAQTPPRLAPGYKTNFETLRRAFQGNRLALVSALTKDGEPRALVCAMSDNQDGTITPVPIAVMVWDNPFEMFRDPTI